MTKFEEVLGWVNGWVEGTVFADGTGSTYYHSNTFLILSLHLEMWSIMCNGADENQAHRCDPYVLRVQEQPLFLVCSSITIFTPMDRSKNSDAGAD